jgi:choloylglycine hydrolase
MKTFFKYLATITFFIFLLNNLSLALACTGIELIAKDGTAINGRTVEFGKPVNPNILLIPRNFEFQSTLPDGSIGGLTYKSKYAVIGGAIEQTKDVVDGLNEAGLSVGAFYFPGYASYPQLNRSNKKHALSPLDFPNWLLTQFATLDEVKAGIKNIVIAPTPFKLWGVVPPFHYVVYDKSGKSIVIEPVNGQLVVHDNPLGIITNSPTFDWQMTNLRNYINLSPVNVTAEEIKGVTLKQFGEGSGLHGLPGDFTPPSRFVRAAIFSTSATPSATPTETVFQVFHILNQFDIPVGAIRSNYETTNVADSTLFTSVKDPTNLIYYFRTYDDQNLRAVHLKSFDPNGKNIKMIMVSGGQPVQDISAMAK